MQLSIIIPVYNIANYLDDCLRTVFTQELNDFEVICVNDGSTDSSQAIIDKYSALHANLICLVQSNQGLSAARNNGLSIAKGDYIFFLDGDDTLANSTSLKAILHQSISLNVDMCVFNALVDGNKTYMSNFPKTDKVMSGIDMMHHFISHCRTVMEPVWAYLYRRRFLLDNALSFKKGIYHEDVLFTPQALTLSKITICIDEAVVDYNTHRNNSITSHVTTKHFTDKLNSARELCAFFKNRNVPEKIAGRIVYNIYVETIQTAIDNNVDIHEQLKSKDYLNLANAAHEKNDRVSARLLRISPKLMVRYRRNDLNFIVRKIFNFLLR